MARTATPIIDMTVDTATAHSAGTAFVHAANHVIDAKGDTGKLLIRIEHTTAAEKTVTIKAPTNNPHAPRAPKGDLVITMAAGNSTRQVHAVVIESARFAQADGKINIDLADAATGAFWVYRLPRGA